MPSGRRRWAAGALSGLILGSLLAATQPGGAQTAADCRQANPSTPEDFGPTDIASVTGNRALSVAVNGKATISVLRWPSPSYYDQIKYRTADRSQQFEGALPNEGSFIGLAWQRTGSDEWSFSWLREWKSRQRYAAASSDAIVTTFSKRGEGLSVTVTDVVAPSTDVLVRRVVVTRAASSQVGRARVISFANFNPVFSKMAQSPYQDWCTEEQNDAGAAYDAKTGIVTATRAGIDASTGNESSVAVAMGFGDRSDDGTVGQDSYETGSGTSAYDDAQDGKLEGGVTATGQQDAAIVRDLSLTPRRTGSATVVIAAAPRAPAARRLVQDAKTSNVTGAKASWWARWLKGARIPRAAPHPITELSLRALISIRQAADEGGLIVSSISTQPSFSLDWIRDGTYINAALEAAGHPEMVEAHNRRYAALQATAASQPPGGSATPPGNWAQNYYADGIVGGSVPYAVDETGLGLYTLWDLYRVTLDGDYLLSVYEEIQRAAQYLTDLCRDPASGLQCVAPEDDEGSPSQTLRGAQAVWLGLDSAARAAEVRADLVPQGRDDALANAARWRERRDEIRDAIVASFKDEGCDCFTTDARVGGTFLWPARAVGLGRADALGQADANWDALKEALSGGTLSGGLEAQGLLGNAELWTAPSDVARLKDGLQWIATTPTTETGLLGAAWMRLARDGTPDESGRVTAMQGQPHVPSLAMFYLAALEIYGSARY